MICVTGAEPSFGEAVARVGAIPDAQLHELRLDLLGALPEPFALPRGPGLVVTLRARVEGGLFDGPPAERARVLVAALRAGARYVDLEAAAPDALWSELSATFGPERLVASAHVFDPTQVDASLLEPILRRLVSRPAAVLKLAVAVTDVVELAALRALDVPDGRPLVRIGMGLAGEAGRVAYRAMGSPWTYARAPSAKATAPGQPSSTDLSRFERGGPPPGLLVLLGGPGVGSSPGPRVYTRLAREESLPYIYVAAPTANPRRALTLLGDLGLVGASVTMPHKTALPGSVTPVGFAAQVGAVNTILRGPARSGSAARDGSDEADTVPGDDGERSWIGHNTDGQGVLGALGGALAAGPRQVVVLGTGGAARAASFALAGAGHSVTVLGRSPQASRALAAELGAGARGGALHAFQDLPFDIVVNATSAGTGGGPPPVPADRSWAGITVLDLVMSPPETALLRAVSRGGGRAVPGLTMWTHQGAAQWSLFTGQVVSPARLARLAEDPKPAGEAVPCR